MRTKKWLAVLTLSAAGSLLLVRSSFGLLPAVKLAATGDGSFYENDNLIIAVRIENQGDAGATGIMVTSITLDGRVPVKPTALPMSVSDLPAQQDTVLQLAFPNRGLNPGSHAQLMIDGTYDTRAGIAGFRLARNVTLAPPNEGSRRAHEAVVQAQMTAGPYPPSEIKSAAEANDDPGPPLPEGKMVGDGQPNSIPTDQRQLGAGLRGMADEQHAGFQAIAPRAKNDPVTLVRKGTKAVQSPISALFPWDPSGASVDVSIGTQVPQHLVFLTGNTYALLSTDGGANFTMLDPTTIFPNKLSNGTLIAGGLCCDQVVQYIPSIDRIVWLMQFWGVPVDTKNGKPVLGRNRIRIAAASPSQVISSNGTQWQFWDLDADGEYHIGKGLLDFPDMAYTDKYLLISIDAALEADSNGLIVTRIPLTDITSGNVSHVQFSDPGDGGNAYGSHLTQYSPSGAFWFGHNSTSNIRIFDWPDDSNTYSWFSLDVESWNNSGYGSATPSFADWLGGNPPFPHSISGATQFDSFSLPGSPNSLKMFKVAWTSGRGNGFSQPHVRLVDFARQESPGVVKWIKGNEAQIYNSGFAFGFPYLASNANHEVGISLASGGGGNEATPLVGFAGDSTMFFWNQSTTSINRWGDFSAIRRHPQNPNLFSVSDYFLNGASGTAFPANSVIHQYRMFGRTADVGGTT